MAKFKLTHYPFAGLIADSAGNLYGTTFFGGASYQGGVSGDGVVFELCPPTGGQTAWTEKVLHSFNEEHGQGPAAGLITDDAGNFYGTTTAGGKKGDGVVFKLTP